MSTKIGRLYVTLVLLTENGIYNTIFALYKDLMSSIYVLGSTFACNGYVIYASWQSLSKLFIIVIYELIRIKKRSINRSYTQHVHQF
jgi:hypothetical protein